MLQKAELWSNVAANIDIMVLRSIVNDDTPTLILNLAKDGEYRGTN